MFDEAYNPKRPSVLGKRALGALEYREGVRKGQAMQSQKSGRRYNLSVTKKLAEEDRKEVFAKVSRRKKLEDEQIVPLKDGDYVKLQPEKQTINQASV